MRSTVQPLECAADGCCPPDATPSLPAAPSTAPALGADDEHRLADLCRALSHPARVTILRVLLEKDMCIAGELAELVPLAASTVSQHLKILKESGLIKGEVDGPRRCYCADKAVVGQLRALIAALACTDR